METVTEDYVSFEVAKLLKDKGFPQEYDIYHSMVYNEEDYENEYEVQRMVLETKPVKAGTLSSYPVGVPEPKCYCPTHQMAMKWLREEKRTSIIIEFDVTKRGYCPYVHQLDYDMDWVVKWRINIPMKYEEAVEVALKYTLENLI